MGQIEPKYRKQLNADQLHILYLLYKFRHGSNSLFVDSNTKKISRQYMNTRLSILCAQNYIGRTFDSSYRLNHQPASYHLLKDGIQVLKQREADFNPNMLRNIGKDKNAKPRTIAHNIGVFNIYNQCVRLHGDDLQFFTKSYLYGRSAFPQPLPDAYITLKHDKTKQILLESIEETTQLPVIRYRIRELVEFFEDDKWPRARPIPVILFVCDTDRLKQKIEPYAIRHFGRSFITLTYSVLTQTELAGKVTLFP